jgi:chorismate synthase
MNTFGNIFRLTSFGESHGEAIGGVIDGCPAGISVDLDFIQNELDRRKPGQSELTTSRKEPDRVQFLSGIYEGKTTGTPIGFMVRNSNSHSSDYDNLKAIFRPSHADYTYRQKYGYRDHRGGGRSSARETIARVVGGAMAKLILKESGISITAYTSQVGSIRLEKSYTELDFNTIEQTPVRCPDLDTARQMIDLIQQVKAEGDTIGGVVTCVCRGIPAGLGEPVFGKLQAALGSAMLSINAVKGFEYGMGFEGVQYKGSEVNDIFYRKPDGSAGTKTNYSGGIQGGISNGEAIYFRVAFKPVPTLLMEQPTIDCFGKETVVKATGRHDPCVLPRAVPIVEAMAAMTILDYNLLHSAQKPNRYFDN